MLKIALKDLKLFFKDKRSVLLTFAIPIALISLFAFAFGGTGSSDEDSKITLLLSDEDKSETSKEAIKLLDSLKSIELVATPLPKAQEAIKKGDENFVLILHKGFADSIAKGKSMPIELQYDQAKEAEVGLLQQSLIPTLSTMAFQLGDPKAMMGQRFSDMLGNASDSTKSTVTMQSNSLFEAIAEAMASSENEASVDPTSNFMGGDIVMTPLIEANNEANIGLIQAVAGTSVLMLLFTVVGIGTSLIDERQEGTLKRLLYSPLRPANILIGKMFAVNFISIIQLIVMFVFASLAFGLDIITPLPGLLVTIVATAFACSAFGVFLASFATSRQQVQGLSTLIILVMSAIGGSMLPIFFMPTLMQKAAVVSVNYWSIQAFYDVFWRNLPLLSGTFLFRIGVLLFIGLALNGLAMFLFKRSIAKS